MKVLVVGSGGREHALGWRLARSSRVTRVVSCPGNGGLAQLGDTWSVPVEGDFAALVEKIRAERIDFVVVGPEAPLVAGLADVLRRTGIPTFGPSALASQLEGSKVFTKRFLDRHAIPTAEFRVVDRVEDLASALDAFAEAPVVKADGLAAGKGVVVASDRTEAEAAARAMLSGERFGAAGHRIVLERRLLGVEVTMLVLVSDTEYAVLEPAQDYKRLGDGNTGPNTGGMGAYSPTGLLTHSVGELVRTQILEPSINALAADGVSFRGILYLGLMLTEEGPQLLEYNVRFGDPETQPLLMRLRTDLVDVFEAIELGRLNQLTLDWDPRSAVCVVMASAGYPTSPARAVPIEGPAISALEDEVQVFHAGTRWRGDRFEATGGRVLGVTAIAPTVSEARDLAYARVDRIRFPGCQYRTDIAKAAGGE